MLSRFRTAVRHRRLLRLGLAAVAVLAVAASGTVTPVAASEATSPQLAADGPPVIIANGWSPPDVGAAAPLAGRLGAPMLYASRESLGEPTIAALRQLAPSRVILMGGAAALSSNVEAGVRRLVPNAQVERLSGAGRIDTAAQANQVMPAGTWPVVIANGWSPPDVGVAAPFAAALGGSVLFSRRETLGDPTVAALRQILAHDSTTAADGYIVGGTSALATSIASELAYAAATGEGNIERVGGTDRVDTAAKIAVRLAEHRPNAPIVLANGWSAADVGIAAPYAAAIGGIVLFAYPGRLGIASAAALKELNAREIVLIGDTETLPVSIEAELADSVPGAWTMRIAGDDRIDTAAKAALDDVLRPSTKPPPSTGTRISAGASHSCGILADFTINCWGQHLHNLLAPPAGKFAHVSSGTGGGRFFACALRLDQTGECWGQVEHDGLNPPGGRFVHIDAGYRYACGIRTTGLVVCWGRDSAVRENTSPGQFSTVSAGASHACGLRIDGTVACWGSNGFGQVEAPAGRFIAVSSGSAHSCATRSDGTVACWGDNRHGELDAPRGPFERVEAGRGYSCGLRTGGTIECWGDSSDERRPVANVPDGSFSEISAAGNHACGLRQDSTAACWGHNSYGRATPPNLRFAPDAIPTGTAPATTYDVLVPPPSTCAPSTATAGLPGPVEGLQVAAVGTVDSDGRSPDPVAVGWTVPCTGGSVDRFVVQWRRAHQQYDESRQLSVPAASGSRSFTTSVPDSSEYAGIYAVRVKATNSVGTGPSRAVVVSTPANDAFAVTEAVVETYGDRYSWLNALWVAFHDGPGHDAQFGIGAETCGHNAEGWGHPGCAHGGGMSLTFIRQGDFRGHSRGNALESIVRGQSTPFNAGTALHELAHLYESYIYKSSTGFRSRDGYIVPAASSPLRLSSTARASFAAALMHLHEFRDSVESLGLNVSRCPAHELFADMPEELLEADGIIESSSGGYWRICTNRFPKDFPPERIPTFPSDETVRVFRSTLVDSEVPQWFRDRFLAADDAWDLRALRDALRGIYSASKRMSRTPYYMMLRDFLLEEPYGGYCSEVQVWEYLDGETDSLPTRRANGGCAVFESVVSSENHSCALRSDKSIACWGSNKFGQLQAPEGVFTSVSVGLEHSCALKSDQSLVCWGRNIGGRTEPPRGSFVSVAAGTNYSCALRTDKSVACWGSFGANQYGQLDAPSGTFTEVAVGPNHACALRSDGTVACWGANHRGQTDAPDGQFTVLTLGRDHSCGLRADKRIQCWGSNDRGQASAPSGLFSSMATTSSDPFGYGYSCAIRLGRGVACWGQYERHRVTPEPPSDEFSSIALSRSHACGRRVDGSIRCWGDLDVDTTQYPLGPFTEITAGLDFSCGLRADGMIECWGGMTDRAQIHPPACRDRAPEAWTECSRKYMPAATTNADQAAADCPPTQHSTGVPNTSYSLSFLQTFRNDVANCRCWIAVNGVAYDVMPAIGGYEYPGPGTIGHLCGRDASEHFRSNGIDPPDVKFARGRVRR